MVADTLSVAASVAGLLSLGMQATSSLYDIYNAYKDRNSDLARTAARLDGHLEITRLI